MEKEGVKGAPPSGEGAHFSLPFFTGIPKAIPISAVNSEGPLLYFWFAAELQAFGSKLLTQ